MATNPTIAVLLRIMDKARAASELEDTDYFDLALAYENAIYKELADLTSPSPQKLKK